MLQRLGRILVAAALSMTALVPAFAAPQEIPPVATEVAVDSIGEPLVVWHREIGVLRAYLPPRTLQDRVKDVVQRIDSVPRADLEAPVTRTPGMLVGHEGILLSVGGRLIVFLVSEDVPEGGNLEEYTAGMATRLEELLRARHAQSRVGHLLRGMLFTLLSAVALGLLLWGALLLRRRLEAALDAFTRKRNLDLGGLNAGPLLLRILLLPFRLAALTVLGTCIYLWLTFVLSLFPYTEPLGRRLGGFLLGVASDFGVAILHSIPGLFMAAVIFALARVAQRSSSRFFDEIVEGRLHVPWLDPEPARASRRLATGFIWVFAFVLAYPHLPGSNTEAFRGVSVLLGLMISLGSAGVMNQLMSGFVIVFSRALKPGEWVRVGATEGTVQAVGVLSTKVVTPLGELITIPNAVLVGDRVVNYSRLAGEQGATLSTSVTIGYDAPWRQVHALLTGAAGTLPALRKEPAPFVLQRALSDFYVEYELRVRHDRPEERRKVLSDLHEAIQDAFHGAGVQIMSPHFEAQPERAVLPRSGGGGETAGG